MEEISLLGLYPLKKYVRGVEPQPSFSSITICPFKGKYPNLGRSRNRSDLMKSGHTFVSARELNPDFHFLVSRYNNFQNHNDRKMSKSGYFKLNETFLKVEVAQETRIKGNIRNDTSSEVSSYVTLQASTNT